MGIISNPWILWIPVILMLVSKAFSLSKEKAVFALSLIWVISIGVFQPFFWIKLGLFTGLGWCWILARRFVPKYSTRLTCLMVIAWLILAFQKHTTLGRLVNLDFDQATGLSFLVLRIYLWATARLATSELNFLAYLKYVFFFPHFFAGPLNPPSEFNRDIRTSWNIKDLQDGRAWYWILRGFCFKFVFADFLSHSALDQISSVDLSKLSGGQQMISAYLYGIVLFFDFAGYSDWARGTARLLGFSTPVNFNKPFLAESIQEFWSRWHMSFSAFLREKIYFPTAKWMMKKTGLSSRRIALPAVFITFLVAAIWHGSAWHYLAYGIHHAVGFVAFFVIHEFMAKNFFAVRKSIVYKGVAIFLTFQWVSLGWFLFLDKVPTYMQLLSFMPK